ncbi:helicase-associated domain-containing protein [Leucobacter sp. USHLN153]|uniref:helicase-associated domain-containing protein n=1 Tax=Leucobacter sp. USHLN153 TaxID=3081268 RepID=UPI00301975F6
MSGTLALASALAEMERDELAALVRARPPHSPGAIADPIGLASELLKTESITRAIATLDREHLAVLAADDAYAPEFSDQIAEELLELGLLGRDRGAVVRLPEVTAALSDALAARGGALEDMRTDPVESEELPEIDLSVWFTAALTAVGQAAECLRSLRDRPGKLNRSGSIAVATLKQLSEATSIEIDDVALVLAALRRAELVIPLTHDHLLVASARARQWLGLTHTARWIRLARAAHQTMPTELRTEWARAAADREDAQPHSLSVLASSIPHRYPLLPSAEFENIEEFVRLSEYLGLTHEGRLTPIASTLLATGAIDEAVVARAMPDAAPGVYVQPDLSVVVPGPLDPENEASLAVLARAEHIGVASTRRISESSITEAYERGLTPAAARKAFEGVSLTGIPQPLEYLLESIGNRVGGIVVGEVDSDLGRTRITIARDDTAHALLVDRSLHHLQLQRSGESETELFSRLSVDHVLAALTDARYHASLQDAAPRAEALEGAVDDEAAADRRSARSPATRVSAEDGPAIPNPLTELAERVYATARAVPGTGDYTRRLELAIRDRSLVLVTAEARGEERTFTLLPVALSAGRLRAADQAAGVERTIPVSMITGVEPA